MSSFIFDATKGGAPVYSNNRKQIVDALTAKAQPGGLSGGIAALADGMEALKQKRWDRFNSDMGAWRSGVSASSPFPPSPGLLFDVGRFLNQRQVPGGMY